MKYVAPDSWNGRRVYSWYFSFDFERVWVTIKPAAFKGEYQQNETVSLAPP
jgi:hypothetical protein